MAQLTPLAFISKWQLRFKPNTTFQIEESDFQEFATDIADTFGVRVENVPEYVSGTTYATKFLVRYTVASGLEAFYYSLQAGKLPAPTGYPSDTNWKVVPGPVPATQLGQTVTLAQARSINGDLVVFNRAYQIELPTASASDPAQCLSVVGIAENWLASEGWLVSNNVRTKVKNIDYVAGTWEVDTSYTKPETNALLSRLHAAPLASTEPTFQLNAFLTTMRGRLRLRLTPAGPGTTNVVTPLVQPTV